MSDNLERFIRNNREKFDQQNPGNEVWNNINTGLEQAAAGTTSAGTAATTAKSGLAKVALAWKVAATAIVAVATVATLYFTTDIFGGGGDKNPPPGGTENLAQITEPDPGKQIEFLEDENSPLVDPPISQADIVRKAFTVDAKKGRAWTATSGTVISVPPNVFVDANGQPIKGKVELQYREFHDAADILLSGIPMVYQAKGGPENFQTAGMMELSGFQDGKPVYIAEGKSIDISLASFTPEDDYNLYYLDPEQKSWVDIGKAEIGENKGKKKGLRMLGDAPEAPQPPTKGEPGKPYEHELGFAADYTEFPELKPFKKIRWEPKDRAYMRSNEWAFTEVWTSIKLEEVNAENMEYRFNLKNRKRKFSVDVKPILEGADYEKAMTKFRKKKDRYDKMLAQRKTERDRLIVQADLMRTFPVTGFGIYNCDRFLSMRDAVTLNATVKFPEGFYMDPTRTVVYQIAGDNRAVVSHSGTVLPGFSYSPREDNFLVAVLPGAKLALFDAQEFAGIDPYALGERREYTFNLKLVDTEIRSAADLRAVLGV